MELVGGAQGQPQGGHPADEIFFSFIAFYRKMHRTSDHFRGSYNANYFFVNNGIRTQQPSNDLIQPA